MRMVPTDVETSSSASVTITVNNIDNDPPIAQDKTIKTGQDSESSTITLVANDPDSDDSSLIYTIASLPTNGKLKDGGNEISNPGDLTGALTYLPNSGYVEIIDSLHLQPKMTKLQQVQ